MPSGTIGLCLLGLLSLLIAVPTIAQQCPAGSVNVSLVNGVVMYGALSEGSPPIDATYDPGTIGGWNNLANGFADSVQRQGLPYELLSPLINQTVSTGFNINDLLPSLQNLASWWAGYLAVTLLGIVVGLLFLIVGGCFWCCRCCGNCGGAKSQRTRENNDCLTFVFATILLLFSLILLAAAVLAFFGNQQTYDSVNDVIRPTLNNVIQHASDYVRDTTREVDDIICQATADGGVIDLVEGEIAGIQQELTGTINNISAQLTTLVNSLNNNALSDVSTLISNVSSEVNAVTMTVSSITAELDSVLMDLTTAGSTCLSIGTVDCSPIITTMNAVNMARSSIPALPDISGQLASIESTISGIGGQITDGQNELLTVLGPQVMDQINSSLQQVEPFITQARTTLNSLSVQLSNIINPIINNTFNQASCPPLEQAFSRLYIPSIDLSSLFIGGAPSTLPPPPPERFIISLGYINQCIINGAFDFLQQFDVYRYAFGIVVCSLALITIVLVWLGLILGLAGFRKDRFPYDRSNVSHCGGICLLVSVGVTFLFGFLLLLLSAIFFFLGSNAFKFCQALQGPDYPAFVNTIDDPVVRAVLLGGADSGLVDSIPLIAPLLRDCEQNNTALFTAADINQILSSVIPEYAGSIEATLNQAFNLSALQGTVDSTITNVASSLNLNQSQITDAIEGALSSIQNTSINFNISSFVTDINTALGATDLNDSVASLQNTSAQLRTVNLAGLADSLENIADALVNITTVSFVQLTNQLNQLQATLDQINAAVENLRQNIMGVANEIGAVATNISGPVLDTFLNQTLRGAVDRSFDYLNSYIRHVDDQILNTVAGCQPVYGIYTLLHNAACRNFLDGLNGWWWSLGFCAILFIPVIIFAVLTSSFFLKKKEQIEEEDYPLKTY